MQLGYLGLYGEEMIVVFPMLYVADKHLATKAFLGRHTEAVYLHQSLEGDVGV